jgi:hypothetical protein
LRLKRVLEMNERQIAEKIIDNLIGYEPTALDKQKNIAFIEALLKLVEKERRSKAKKKKCPGDCNCRDCGVEVKAKPKKEAKLGSWDNPKPMPDQ